MTKWEYVTVPLLVHATKQILDNWGCGRLGARADRAGPERRESGGLPEASGRGMNEELDEVSASARLSELGLVL